jgi:uncharacterized membrane protein
LEEATRRIRTMIRVGSRGQLQSVNDVHDDTMTVGQRIADAVARNMGSWHFIIIQSSILCLWIIFNAVELIFKPWDPYPFILLNLMLSFQAAYAAPFIMMSQNRQADKDRLAAEHDYCINIRSEARIHAVLDHLQAQDDVMLAILRQLEDIHHIAPDKQQQEAEVRLAKIRANEEDWLRAAVLEEEKAMGLVGSDIAMSAQ